MHVLHVLLHSFSCVKRKKTVKCVLILLLSGCETSEIIFFYCVCVFYYLFIHLYNLLFVSIILLCNPGCAMMIKFNLESMFVDTFWMLYNTFR